MFHQKQLESQIHRLNKVTLGLVLSYAIIMVVSIFAVLFAE